MCQVRAASIGWKKKRALAFACARGGRDGWLGGRRRVSLWLGGFVAPRGKSDLYILVWGVGFTRVLGTLGDGTGIWNPVGAFYSAAGTRFGRAGALGRGASARAAHRRVCAGAGTHGGKRKQRSAECRAGNIGSRERICFRWIFLLLVSDENVWFCLDVRDHDEMIKYYKVSLTNYPTSKSSVKLWSW